jgi:uncharacterized protein YkwD
LFVISILFCRERFTFAQTAEEQELLSYINSEREREKIPPLIWDDELYAVAREHSDDMVGMGKVSHTGSDNSQPHERIRSAGIFASKTAENIARDLNVVSAHTSLMESLYHRENILDPEMTHAATGVIHAGKYIYVTELFIRKVELIDSNKGSRRLLSSMNEFREKKGLLPVTLSERLSEIAQSHVNVQEKLNALSPPLLMNQLTKQVGGSIRINVFTTSTPERVPEEVYPNLEGKSQMVGIGMKRIRGKLCETGCYLITLIFGYPVSE